jgi:soluble lytic murein transglycosylase-like protein
MLILSMVACLSIHIPRDVPYSRTISKISCQHNVDPRLVVAIISTESGFRRYAKRVERDGNVSIGLMQIKVRTARWLGFRGSPEKLYAPWINVYYGVRYLSMNLKRYGDVWDAVSAYNAGHSLWSDGSVDYWNKRYVSSVFREYSRLSQRSHHYPDLVQSTVRKIKKLRIVEQHGTLYAGINR